MKYKNDYKKIFFLCFFFIILISFFSIIYTSRADEEGDDNNEALTEREVKVPDIPEPQTETIPPAKINIPKRQDNNSVQTRTNNTAQVIDSWKDSDKDGVPDKLDKHPGEDDFAYSINDANQNGIADELELLLK